MDALIGWFENFWNALKVPLTWLLDGFLYVLKLIFFIALDGLLTTVQSFFLIIDLTSLSLNAAAYWSGLPPQLIYIINAVGLPTCLGIIANAIFIRLVLNLIPAAFTRI